jgi:protein-disulfide isomerase
MRWRALPLLLLATVAAAEPVPTSGSRALRTGPLSGGSPLLRGPSEALVTIDFFCSLASPPCARAERTLRALAARYPDEVRIVYRLVDPPLGSGRRLAHAAHEAARLGRQVPFLDAVFDDPTASLSTLASRAGLDPAVLATAVDGRRHEAAIDADQRLRELLSSDILPSAFLNGRSHLPFVEPALLERAFADARARALEDVAAGIPPRRLHELGVSGAIAERASALRGAASGARPPVPGGVWVPHDDRGLPARGEEGARTQVVTVVFFADLDASISRRQLATLTDLGQRFPGQIRLLVRLLPGRAPQRTSLAAACARDVGRFWPFVEKLVTMPYMQPFPSQPGVDRLLLTAQAAGMSPQRLTADLDAGRCARGLLADQLAAQRAGVVNAPALLVGGWRLLGYRSLAELTLLTTDELRPGWLARAAPSGD